MRKLWYAAAILASVTALTGPSFSMGGGGGGGGGGGSYGGSGLSSGTSSTDDYTVALRLIKHQQYADAIPHLNLALAGPAVVPLYRHLSLNHALADCCDP